MAVPLATRNTGSGLQAPSISEGTMHDQAQSRYSKLAADGTALPIDAKDHVFVVDRQLGLMWPAATTSSECISHADAEAMCRELRLGDFDDWRMPTIDELESLRDRSRFNPAINTDLFPDTKSDWYWSSTISAWSSDCAWIVGFHYGSSYDLRRANGYAFVRAVRSVPAGQ